MMRANHYYPQQEQNTYKVTNIRVPQGSSNQFTPKDSQVVNQGVTISIKIVKKNTQWFF